MELEKAKTIAGTVVKALEPHCERIEVAGSIRRRKAEVKDIDLVLIPRDRQQLDQSPCTPLARECSPLHAWDIKLCTRGCYFRVV